LVALPGIDIQEALAVQFGSCLWMAEIKKFRLMGAILMADRGNS
jgi:hypothetical protein